MNPYHLYWYVMRIRIQATIVCLGSEGFAPTMIRGLQVSQVSKEGPYYSPRVLISSAGLNPKP